MESRVLFSIYLVITIAVSTSGHCPGFTETDFNSTDIRPKIHIHSTPGKVELAERTVLVKGVGVIRLDCYAPFPIDFEFDGHLSNREATVDIIQRKARNYSDVSTFCFHINVTVNSLEEITGEYSCFPVQDRALNTSYYIYYAANPPETLLNRGQTVNVEAIPSKEWVTIPCATSNPNVTVRLYDEKNQLIGLGADVKFDPRYGFTVKKTLLGKFQCRTELSELDVVDVQILPPRKYLVSPPESIVIVKEGDKLKLSCESVEDIRIDYDRNIPMSNVNGRPRYDSSRKLDFLLDFESGALSLDHSGTVTCKTKSGNHTLHTWIIQVREARSSQQKMQGMNLNYLCGGEPKFTLFDCNNWIECKMRKCKKMDRKCYSEDCRDSNTFNCIHSGIWQCYNRQNETVKEVIYFSGLGRNASYTNIAKAPGEDILKIRNLTQDGRSVSPVKVVCEGSTFAFAVGFKWLVLTKGGLQQEISPAQIEHKWRSSKLKHIIKSTLKINISDELTSIICLAPVWNSTEWKSDELDLTGFLMRTSSLSASISAHTSQIILLAFLALVNIYDKSTLSFPFLF